ncbi:MAG: zinc-ribbon domain-containing protein [bacterium]|nr:zinc-ribbon domain-containing protein [candidate division WOR-3 bacterium]
MRCWKCGTQNSVDRDYCRKCGAALSRREFDEDEPLEHEDKYEEDEEYNEEDFEENED